MKIIFSRDISFYTFRQHSGSCLKLEKPHCENFLSKYIKKESRNSYLGINEQKTLFPVVFWSNAHFDLFYSCILRARSGAQVKLRPQKIGHGKWNLSGPAVTVKNIQMPNRKSSTFLLRNLQNFPLNHNIVIILSKIKRTPSNFA